ncbi:protein kinase [Paenibacillus sp. Marseille-Q4541]|uniref:serine/threonine protein kinase n=1 Tax=Paenibacillus sp. Marseille-Q4541 TaxID=2831522 RepID=UPI002019DE59|nr:protein kinase [Paenibacillus sp. Marseille-Q4541]
MLRLITSIRSFISAWRDDPAEEGTRLGQRYVVQEVLGEGSYGITYKCLDQTVAKTVAVKQARPSKGSYAVKLLLQEAEIIKMLQHQGIPAFIDFFREKGNSYLVMSYMEGDTLEDLIFGQGVQYQEIQTVQMTLQLLDLVEYVHRQGYVHLDLRIPNVLFNEGRLLLIDFGLARRLGEEPLPRSSLFSRRTTESRSSAGKKANEHSDLYDIGHFMLFMLYSTYEAPETTTSLDLHMSQTERSWQEELGLSDDLKLIIERLFGIEEPYHSSEELREALNQFVSIKKSLCCRGRV